MHFFFIFFISLFPPSTGASSHIATALRNDDSICYANTLISCLYDVTSFRKAVYDNFQQSDIVRDLAGVFAVKQINTIREYELETNLMSTINRLAPSWNAKDRQNVDEFWELLFELLPTSITNNFGHVTRERITTTEDDSYVITEGVPTRMPLITVHLPIISSRKSSTPNFQDLVDSALSGSETSFYTIYRKIHPDYFESNQISPSVSEIPAAPVSIQKISCEYADVVPILITRRSTFSFCFHRDPLCNMETLTFPSENGRSEQYNLISFAIDNGSHYYASTKSFPSGKWIVYNDERVKEADMYHLLKNLQTRATLLFYVKKGSSAEPSLPDVIHDWAMNELIPKFLEEEQLRLIQKQIDREFAILELSKASKMRNSDDCSYDLLKGLPFEGAKGREKLNNFIKRVRSGQLSLEELVASIRAFEVIIYCDAEVKVSPAYGGLLGHLFSQLELSWRGEILGHDIRSIQMVLLKKILLPRQAATNLVIWTAGLKEIRMLSGAAKEFVISWILGNVQTADESDWSIIFHNLILMSTGNGALLTKVFEGIDECLRSERESRKSLLDHLIFLIGQNASLGKMWVKWVLGKGAFKINPLVFSGLLSLSQLDTDYCNTLTGALQSNIRLMSEISVELGRVKFPVADSVSNVTDYLKMVVAFIGSDSELGIRGALQLIEALKVTHNTEMSEFYLELFRLHPFARRELLHHQVGFKVWRQINELDPMILKEHLKENREKIADVSREAPELLCHLIEHEDEIAGISIEALMAIDSVLLLKALKQKDSIFSFNNFNFNKLYLDIPLNWNDLSAGEISAIKYCDIDDAEFIAKMVELCELLSVPGAIENSPNRENLIDLAVDFVSDSSDVFSEKERISMISKVIASGSGQERRVNCLDFSGVSILRLFERNAIDWNNYAGTLKYVLERIYIASEEFYRLILRVPTSAEFQILTAKALCRFDGCELNGAVAQFIGNVAERVVAEPQLGKYFQGLLTRKYSCCNEKISITKFTEISEPGLIKSIVEFGLEHESIEGLKGEVIKSILMFYGIIEEDSDAASNGSKSVKSGSIITPSKFKNIHLNEKSVNFVLNALLNTVQRDLEMAHKLIKSVFDLIVVRKVDEYLRVWVEGSLNVFVGLTRGLISGRGGLRLHSLLASFYELCTKLVQMQLISEKSVQLVQTVSGQLNRQVYAMIPLQQEKIQTVLKQNIALKKDKSSTVNTNTNANGKSITKLIYEMEKFEENLIRRVQGGEKWCDKIVRSTARDFKIRLEQL